MRLRKSRLTSDGKENHTNSTGNKMKMARKMDLADSAIMEAIFMKDNSKTECTMASADTFMKMEDTTSENIKMECAWDLDYTSTQMARD